MASTVKLINGVSETVLHTCLQRERRAAPAKPLSEQLRNVARHVVPANVPGSPAYHRTALHDLKAVVARRGLPTLFLTLTSDEVSELRWYDVVAFEALLNRLAGPFDNSLTWQHIPAEMQRLFVDRTNTFLKQHVLCGDAGIFGRVTLHLTRYESQVRGRECHGTPTLYSYPPHTCLDPAT